MRALYRFIVLGWLFLLSSMAWCQRRDDSSKIPSSVPSAQVSPTIPHLTDANPEIVRLVIDDHWERGNDMFGKGQVRDPSSLDWRTVGEHDAARRKEVRGLLAKGEIKTGSDYYFSALIFQHSNDAQGFILAHVLSVTSVAKGNNAARYMADATMDRYLHSISQPQIFGTQFFHTNDNTWTMDPYDRDAISDAERAVWCVAPPVAAECQSGYLQPGRICWNPATRLPVSRFPVTDASFARSKLTEPCIKEDIMGTAFPRSTFHQHKSVSGQIIDVDKS